jgi:hypothetical protein
MSEHPGKVALSILGVLILLSLVGAIAKRSHHGTAADANPTPTTQAQAVTALANPMPPPPAPSTSRPEIQGQDRYDHTIRFREYERQQRLTRPAYQHLPYRTSQVRIAITNVTSDGRLVLSVTPLSSNVSPQVEYRTFLARYHDPGSAYFPSYGRYGK